MKSLIFAASLLVLPLVSTADHHKSDKKLAKIEKEQTAIREMRDKTLEELFAQRPEARAEAENSEAVAVFSSLGFNVLLLSTARGGGIVKETATGDETFMRMLSVGGGFGMGVKDFRVVFIFHTRTAFENFLEKGWDFAGQGDGAAKMGDKGDAMELAATAVQGTSLYQLTENGLALQVTLQGTKYYKDKDLN
jgi:lipid-binding SYLF domain-containing protein